MSAVFIDTPRPLATSEYAAKTLTQSMFPPAFASVQIYGTAVEPMFVAQDVQTALGIQNLHYSGADSQLEWGVDRVKTTINGKATILLTEIGLYGCLFRSRAESARQFQRFVVVVLRQLRIHGSVAVDEGLTAELAEERRRYQAACAARDEAQRLYESRDRQLDEEHAARCELQDRHTVVEEQLWIARRRAAALEQQTKNHSTDAELECRIEWFEIRYMSEYSVYADADPDDDDTPTPVSFSRGTGRTVVASVRAHQGLADVLGALAPYRVGKGTGAPRATSTFECTINNVRECVSELNRNYERGHAAPKPPAHNI